MTTELHEAIARLRKPGRYSPALIRTDLVLVCDALEAYLNPPRFDKTAYMREYMRKRRAKEKA